MLQWESCISLNCRSMPARDEVRGGVPYIGIHRCSRACFKCKWRELSVSVLFSCRWHFNKYIFGKVGGDSSFPQPFYGRHLSVFCINVKYNSHCNPKLAAVVGIECTLVCSYWTPRSRALDNTVNAKLKLCVLRLTQPCKANPSNVVLLVTFLLCLGTWQCLGILFSPIWTWWE